MNIGILGTGSIARTMAYTINNMQEATLYAVASRTPDKAKSFAEEFSAAKAYGSYEELVKDDNVELVYIATPHSRHYEDCLLCLENGKNVICEKAFTATLDQAGIVLSLAEEKELFITEAMWTRFLPMRYTLDEIIKSRIIGRITWLEAELGYDLHDVERLQKPELAGGALLDLGVYPINFALMAFGTDILKVEAECEKNEYGVDSSDIITLNYDITANCKLAFLKGNMNKNLENNAVINGTKGQIIFKNINNCEGIEVRLNSGEVIKYETPEQITGYEYEIRAAIKAISEGKIECDEMPHSETIRVMNILDQIREKCDIELPFDEY
ncbi:MAG: Gfo/Idh/MocA family oxidoreductase [Ruminococcus sp.]|nr:Gfo/Idh/MocA family oxidoreductase [Ruminococcus sp.]